MISQVQEFKKVVTEEGLLAIVEGSNCIPFEIGNIYCATKNFELNEKENVLIYCLRGSANYNDTLLKEHCGVCIEKENLSIKVNGNSFLLVLFDKSSIIDETNLTAILDKDNSLDYTINRLYYIANVPSNITRGYHAHKELKQYLTCVSGSCVVTIDDGSTRKDNLLDNPKTGLRINPCKWREMSEFSKDAILLAIVSERYNEADYIRNYDEFIEYLKG